MSAPPAAARRLALVPDLIIHLGPDGEWLVSNPRAHTHLALSPSALELLRRHRFPETDPLAGLDGLWVEDRTVFGCRDCLLDDPTGLSLDSKPAARLQGAEAVLAKLRERYMLVDDLAVYQDRFALKTKPIDPDHFGNFHQQMGHELVFRQRKNPDAWWVSQKFTDDLKGVKNTAYRKVQEEFLKRQIPRWELAGKKVLDVGCGIGYYSHAFARAGGKVLGIDPNADYIKRARETFCSESLALDFRVFDFSAPAKLSELGAGAFDFIYLADVLLFYFISYKNKPEELAGAVGFLKALRGLLSPAGRIVVMDPHGSFSLCGRFGDPEHPLAVLNEYKRKVFGIAANLQDLAHAFRGAGLRIADIWEPVYEDPNGRDREDAFLREFPTWWVFELTPG